MNSNTFQQIEQIKAFLSTSFDGSIENLQGTMDLIRLKSPIQMEYPEPTLISKESFGKASNDGRNNGNKNAQPLIYSQNSNLQISSPSILRALEEKQRQSINIENQYLMAIHQSNLAIIHMKKGVIRSLNIIKLPSFRFYNGSELRYIIQWTYNNIFLRSLPFHLKPEHLTSPPFNKKALKKQTMFVNKKPLMKEVLVQALEKPSQKVIEDSLRSSDDSVQIGDYQWISTRAMRSSIHQKIKMLQQKNKLLLLKIYGIDQQIAKTEKATEDQKNTILNLKKHHFLDHNDVSL